MKIRTRLLLSLLPAFIGGVVLISIWISTSFPLLLPKDPASMKVHIDQVFVQQLSLTIFGAAILLIIAAGSLYWIAGRISKPIQKMNNSALAIAAGHYGESVQVKGPKELQELANTLNTMSQCLLENINRLKENACQQEKMIGEAECARILQHLMLQKNIDDCSSEFISIKAITFSSITPRGLRIDFPISGSPNLVHVHVAEAKSRGLDGIYQLLTQYKPWKEQPPKKIVFPSLRLTFNCENTVLIQSAGFAEPLHWSLTNEALKEIHGTCTVEAGDLILIINQGFYSFFNNVSKRLDLVERVFKYFAQDGLETILAMLQKEITFAIKRKELIEDLHLICIQILKTSPLTSAIKSAELVTERSCDDELG